MKEIPFTVPFLAGTEIRHLGAAIEGDISSGGPFTSKCERWLAATASAKRALLSHSGTGAMEAATMVAGVGAGDEVIMPSFGFATTAGAVVRQGATPVFVDIDPRTLNIDVEAVEAAIGRRTKALIAVHYGGVGCAMDELLSICAAHEIVLIEDAAHCLLASYKGRALGGIGALGTISFHHTKNVTSGEGGCLLVNAPSMLRRAEAIWENGTDRARFLRGEVERYSWVEIGSSFAASELTAAFLYAQLEVAKQVTARRRAIWDRYHEAFVPLEAAGRLRAPHVPEGRRHNGHLYYLLLSSQADRDAFIAHMRRAGVGTAFHYTPLHSSPAGMLHGRCAGLLSHTDRISGSLVRLPLYPSLDEQAVQRVIDAACAALGAVSAPAAG